MGEGAVRDSSMPASPEGVRGRLGAIAQKIFPDLDERAYFRARDQDVREREQSGQYPGLKAQFPDSLGLNSNRHAHVVVIPQEGHDFESWAPGTRNFYFEAAQNLRELVGDSMVSVFHVERGEPYGVWHKRLVEYLIDSGATHILTHIESDPGSEATEWTWDSLWTFLAPRWDGVLLGVMFDSSYRFINAKSKYLARISPRFMVVDICMPMNNSMQKGRIEVGPVNMPISRQSLELVDQRIANTVPEFDISFIGVLYPYRIEMLEALRAAGLSVAVNPHRPDASMNSDLSRVNQPSWIEYMAGLASSRSTINFSRSNAGPFEQLKTRIIEAGLAGTFLFTDDKDRTRLFWDPATFGYFEDSTELPKVVKSWFEAPERLESARQQFSARSRELAIVHFWQSIEQGLELRGLPSISKTLLHD